MIAVDWGTSSFRAFRLQGARTLDHVSSDRGIMRIEPGGFEATLRAAVGPWLALGESHILMSGMIGSRQGWAEAAYLPCPADAAALAARLLRVPFDGAELRIVPGLQATDAGGTPEVMRGEETQIIGSDAAGLVCLPGSHSKWAQVGDAGEILGFHTYLSGEAFAAIRAATILGRMMPDAAPDDAAFDRGVARSGAEGHLLHHLFGVRTLGLMGELAPEQSASYLSGLLIGHEIRSAMPAGASVTLLGSAGLCALYGRAIAACGGTPLPGPPMDAAARGLSLIGQMTAWT